jgi:hypothetical protein
MAEHKKGIVEAAVETGVGLTEAMTGAMKAATEYIAPTQGKPRSPKKRATATTTRSKAAPPAQRGHGEKEIRSSEQTAADDGCEERPNRAATVCGERKNCGSGQPLSVVLRTPGQWGDSAAVLLLPPH